jgi:hypothetical protein
MAELKTTETEASVAAFLATVADAQRREDCRRVLEIMRSATGVEPKMWGDSIVGFGSYHYRYESGREGDWFVTGFSPRKSSLTLYIMAGFDRYEALLSRLGKHSTGKSCLYIRRLADVDEAALRQLVAASVQHMRATHNAT